MTQNLMQQSPLEDQIDVRNIIKILIDFKKLIISIILIFTLAGFVYSLFMKPSFQTISKIELGYFVNINGAGFVSSPSGFMDEIYFLKLRKYPEEEVSIKLSDNRLLTLKAESNSIENNEKILNDLISFTIDTHLKFTEMTFDSQTQEARNLQFLIEDEIKSFTKLLQENQDAKLQDKILASNELFKLNQELSELKSSLNKFQTQKQTIVETIGDPEIETIKPKALLVIFLSIIIGSISSILLVLTINFIKSFKENEA